MAGSRERQRQRARERHERHREERRQRQSQLRKRLSIGAIVVLVLGLVAGLSLVFVGGSTPAAKSKPKATASASATSSAAAVAEPAHHCTYTSNGSGKPSLPTASPDYNASYTAAINTNLGKIGISLLNSKATCTVNSFAHLAETNFFNNTQCWRVSNSSGLYLLQCGDPNATAKSKLSCSSSTLGSGGPGYQFADENLTGATYPAGTVAMANGGANTNGSQFFLVFKSTTLPASYTPFGKITSGLDILQNVAKAGTSCTIQAGGGVPKKKVIINSVTVKKS
ncbi:MAG: peptidylprolyl isomerase [Trebonia sp.]|uniref:peptidylprolyl isomerase n=1 Tax=Trebonia sp. TaxID=2767075 RepID=UPI003BB21F4B